MKNLVVALALTLGTVISVNAQKLKGNVNYNDVKVESLSISVEVDSAEEIESTFSIEDFEEILNETEAKDELSFKIKCNGKKMSNGKSSSVSYTVKGNINEKQKFLESIAKVRASAIKYYNSKK
ncbi:hypothetical protein ACFQ1Q_07240 [Winogradskyella litorisediminis]|uniref:Uncharacterized protein n=1 Tax=Winogradskyella litorisediminis TaxID=1156618 RepID=A0ABW3N925_9FLAO